MRRLSTVVMAALVVLGALSGLSGSAGAATTRNTFAAEDIAPTLQVVKISGLLDPVLADFLAKSVSEANQGGSIGVLLQVNSRGSVISDDRLRDLATMLHESKVPIVAWVGPSGARAEGGMAQLLATVTTVGLAPGSNMGNTGKVVVPLEQWSPAFRTNEAKLRSSLVGSGESKTLGMAPKDTFVLRQALLEVPGFRVKTTTAANGQELPATQLLFSQVPTGAGLMHTVASPAVAYLLFVIGLGLIIFELFTAGVGIAGLVGAGSFVLGSYGIWVLPVRWWALALILVAMVAYVVDIQIGVPRVWTGIASVLFTVGTFTLFTDVPMPWLALVGGVIGMLLFMVYGMPSMTRTRFSTPSIPRDWMIGMEGVSIGGLTPTGIVQVDGATWPGRVADGETLSSDTPVDVVSVDGVVLEVARRAG